MTPSQRNRVRTVVVAVSGLTVVGAVAALVIGGTCEGTPRAPALVTEAVYENSELGLTFNVPGGWVASARSTAPLDTTFSKPHRLVRYQSVEGEAAGTLELYAIDLPPGNELLAYLSEGRNQIGSERWSLNTAPQPETINGTPCIRYPLTETKKKSRRRDIIAFDRGNGRIYAFLLSYSAGSAARQQGGRSIESIRWR